MCVGEDSAINCQVLEWGCILRSVQARPPKRVCLEITAACRNGPGESVATPEQKRRRTLDQEHNQVCFVYNLPSKFWRFRTKTHV